MKQSEFLNKFAHDYPFLDTLTKSDTLILSFSSVNKSWEMELKIGFQANSLLLIEPQEDDAIYGFLNKIKHYTVHEPLKDKKLYILLTGSKTYTKKIQKIKFNTFTKHNSKSWGCMKAGYRWDIKDAQFTLYTIVTTIS